MKNLIIYGVGSQAEVAYSYFQIDSDYRTIAFTVEQSYIKEQHFQELPLIPFEEIENHISPDDAEMYIAVGPIKVCSVLESYFLQAKAKGYTLASYHSSVLDKYFVPKYGENCFIDHASFFHPFIKLGNGVTLNNAHIGHHCEIGDFTFLTSALLGGRVIVEDHVFIGMRATIKEGVRIGKGSIIGMECIITKDVEPFSVYNVSGTNPRKHIKSHDVELFKTR